MRVFLVVLVSIFLSSCTNLSFNQRYKAVGWDKVIIAPFTGKHSAVAEKYFEHQLAVFDKIEIVSPRLVKQLMIENKLTALYENNKEEAIFELARIINADGIVFSELITQEPANSIGPQLNQGTASLHSSLIDAKNKSYVASSLHSKNSIFYGIDPLIEDVTNEAVEDFEQFFIMIQ